MKYTKNLGMLVFAIILTFGAMAVSANAQRHFGHRPVVVRHYWGGGGFYRPFGFGAWDNPYWNDPYYWDMRERYYDRKSANDAAHKLTKDRAKYAEDGIVSAKEQEKLAKDQRELDKKRDKVRRDDY